MSRATPLLALLLVTLSCLHEPPDGGAAPTATGQIVSTPPASPDPTASYLLYLHGKIIEDQGVRPHHPSFGIYEYEQILQRLADAGLVVISEPRPAGTEVVRYAERVVSQVRGLLDRGVPADRITVVGFSKGGAIAIHVSSLLANDEIRVVLLAACAGWIEQRPDLLPHGRLLSLTEASDEIAGTCQPLFDRRAGAIVSHEMRLSLGGGHGAFYRPNDAWLEPVIQWATARPGTGRRYIMGERSLWKSERPARTRQGARHGTGAPVQRRHRVAAHGASDQPDDDHRGAGARDSGRPGPAAAGYRAAAALL